MRDPERRVLVAQGRQRDLQLESALTGEVLLRHILCCEPRHKHTGMAYRVCTWANWLLICAVTSAIWSLDIRVGPFDRFFIACFTAAWREFLKLAPEALSTCLRCFAMVTDKSPDRLLGERQSKRETDEDFKIVTESPSSHESFAGRLDGESRGGDGAQTKVVRLPPSHPLSAFFL